MSANVSEAAPKEKAPILRKPRREMPSQYGCLWPKIVNMDQSFRARREAGTSSSLARFGEPRRVIREAPRAKATSAVEPKPLSWGCQARRVLNQRLQWVHCPRRHRTASPSPKEGF